MSESNAARSAHNSRVDISNENGCTVKISMLSRIYLSTIMHRSGEKIYIFSECYQKTPALNVNARVNGYN